MPAGPEQAIFIIGVEHRSGTNFLSDLLALHDDCCRPATIGEDFLLHHAEHLRRYAAGLHESWNPEWRDSASQADIGAALGRVCYRYAGHLYRRFDAVFALSENGGASKLRASGVDDVDIAPLGVELGDFGPDRRDEQLRRSLGLSEDQPLLIYAGRFDVEKKPDQVVEAFRRLPESLGARIRIDTGSGGIDTDIPIQVNRTERNFLSGSIGDGKGEIIIDTGSGGVRLRRS